MITHADEDLFMMELCYKILNKNKSVQDMYESWNNIVDKANEFYDFDEEKIEALEIPYDVEYLRSKAEEILYAGLDQQQDELLAA